jgi:FlaA1/EpsC-like NDP-sugar epimerase
MDTSDTVLEATDRFREDHAAIAYDSEENRFFAGKRIVVTGAAGTVGAELVRQLLRMPVAEVRGLDNHETGLFLLSESLKHDKRFQPFICDVRSGTKLGQFFKSMDYCFHTAALKHVPSSERSPFEAVETNINGVQNVLQAAMDCDLKRMLFTSSDKAVNPTNVMGTTKLMGERLVTAANAIQGENCVFTSTRFGNVAGSAGSMVPLFCQQIMLGGPVTLTDPQMTRFIMTLSEAVRLVIASIRLARGGEVFVAKMPVVRIKDVVEVLVDLVAPLFGRNPGKIEIHEVGPRPGEKLYEELTNDEEVRRTVELDRFFAVLPAFRNIYDRISYEYPNAVETSASKVYNSALEAPMGKAWIRQFLLKPQVLPEAVAGLLATLESTQHERGAA